MSAVQFGGQISAVGLGNNQPSRPSHPALDAAATLLGMSASDLRTAMQSGQSIASVASSKGITQDQLTSAMAEAIQQANPGIAADQATKVATALATLTPSAGGPGAAGSPPPAQVSNSPTIGTSGTTAAHGHHGRNHHHAQATAVDATSQLLGMSTSDLVSATQQGQSLSSIASSVGVSQSDLVSTIAQALQQTDSNLSGDQATQLATQLATQQLPAASNSPWTTSSGASSTISVTA
jgi:transposase-like protein